MTSTLVFPGSEIPIPSSSKAVTFGPGIAASSSRADPDDQTEPRFVATRAGLLTSAKAKDRSENLWVEGVSKRYIPAQRDLVLGTIVARHAEGYRVDLGSAHMAALDALAFEGATKRSKPNLKVSRMWSRGVERLGGGGREVGYWGAKLTPRDRSERWSTPVCPSPTATWSPKSSVSTPRQARRRALAS